MCEEVAKIWNFLQGVKLSDGLTDVEIGEMHAHICLIEEVMKSAEVIYLFLSLVDYLQLHKTFSY